MQRPKIYELLDDETFGIDAINVETGMVITDYGDCALFAILFYPDKVEAYTNICDDEEPYRNFLGQGIAETRDAAADISLDDLYKQAYANIN